MKGLWGMTVLIGMAALFGGIGCSLTSNPEDSTSHGSLQPSPIGTSQESHDWTGFKGLPVVRLSYICSESSEICVFRDGDFRNDANLDGGELSHIEFDSEVGLVPQAEYMIECSLRNADDDWERSMLGAIVEECLFEVTLAAYPVDSEEVRSAGLQLEPVPPPVGIDPRGAILPPAAFPPGPSRTAVVQTIEAMHRQADYRAECTIRPPVNSESGVYLVPAVWKCGIVGSRSGVKFPDSP